MMEAVVSLFVFHASVSWRMEMTKVLVNEGNNVVCMNKTIKISFFITSLHVLTTLS